MGWSDLTSKMAATLFADSDKENVNKDKFSFYNVSNTSIGGI